MSKLIYAVFTINLFTPNLALAYCSAPTMFEQPPSQPAQYTRPSPPFCLMNYSITRTHTCDSWEIDMYIDEVNGYIDQLNDYVNDAQIFANTALNFADDASRYANCEADDIKSEIE